jgi:hypothetical protein
MSKFVAPSGYIDLDNDCQYSIDLKSTRSRESVDPKDDLAFYFQTYIIPKYGLNDINVNNCASFMKDLEMNWTKLTPDLKDKVLDIMVDGIFSSDSGYDFKNRFLAKLGSKIQLSPAGSTQSAVPLLAPSNSGTKSSFGAFSKSSFGTGGKILLFIALFLVTILIVFLVAKSKGMI